MLVKRILALPGDRVQTLPPYPDQYVTIPPGHAWVEGKIAFALQSGHSFRTGDDQWRSKDSNHFGPVSLKSPFNRIYFTPTGPTRTHRLQAILDHLAIVAFRSYSAFKAVFGEHRAFTFLVTKRPRTMALVSS